MRRRRPSHATIVAYLALFIALGGTSYAAIRITGRNVVDGSLELRDISRKARVQLLAGGPVLGSAGRDGAAGRDGVAGQDGAPGRNGSAGQNGAPGRDGADATDRSPTHVIDVDPAGSALERGTALLDALNVLGHDGDADAYVVRLGPGVYDLRQATLVPPGNVDLQGAGSSLTTLTFDQTNTAIFLTDDTEFRDLRIQLDGDGSVIDVNGADARLERVSVTRFGHSNSPVLAKAGNATLIDSTVRIPTPYGGIAVDASWPWSYSRSITGTRIDVAGDGAVGLVLGAGSQTTITDSEIAASGSNARAVVATAEALNHTWLIGRHSELSATGSGRVAVELSGPAHLRAGATQIDGPVTLGTGATAVCAGSWNGAYAVLDATCN
jgi:hypothetical protein